MRLIQLIKKEILYRKVSFIFSLLSVIVSVLVFVIMMLFIHAYDIQTNVILKEKQDNIKEEMARLEDDYRKIMLKLGLNMFILPKDQQLDNFYEDGYASKYFPENYMQKLSASNIMSIRHLLPLVEKKIHWEEKGNRTIILVGISGEVPFTKRLPLKAVVVAVPPGSIVLGYELWDSLNLKIGDKVKLSGETFTVSKLHPRRGTKDDITAWIDLGTAQRLLNLQGKLSGIMALQCFCHGLDLDKIREDIFKFLPDTKVIFFKNEVVTRAKARSHAREIAENSLLIEKQNRLKIHNEMEAFASWLIPVIIVISIILIVFLSLNNMKQRKIEIAIMGVLGFRSGQIFFVFLVKALFIGIGGAAIGIIITFLLSFFINGIPSKELITIYSLKIYIAAFLGAPVLSMLAGWIPAVLAVHKDPATILREEQ